MTIDIYNVCNDNVHNNVDRIMKDHVIDKLKLVIDHHTSANIISCGYVYDIKIVNNDINIILHLPNYSNIYQSYLKTEILAKLEELDWPNKIDVSVASKNDIKQLSNPGRLKAKSILAVFACKGGVGKSTLAVNIAYELSLLGANVGICDLDIYGPNLNVLIPVLKDGKNEKIEFIQKTETDLDTSTEDELLMKPLVYNNVKLMSAGYLIDDAQYLSLRGPAASQIIKELIFNTDWGNLDYLILDLPPGIGDIVVSLVESVPITGAILVTTPSLLSIADINRGIEFFKANNIEIFGLIMNMCLPKYVSIEQDPTFEILREWEQPKIDCPYLELPMCEELGSIKFKIKKTNQIVYPFSLAAKHSQNQIKIKLANYIENIIINNNNLYGNDLNNIDINIINDVLLEYKFKNHLGTEEIFVRNIRDLRLACSCNTCLREPKGLDNKLVYDLPSNLTITKLINKSNYGILVKYSDNHVGIIKYSQLKYNRYQVDDTQEYCSINEINW